jgi:hypothetical protein
MVLVSIIVGLGVTELLSNVASQIRARSTSRPYWLHSVLIASIFVALLQQWWEGWGLQNEEDWSFPILLMMLGGPILLYTASHVAFPSDIDRADFRIHYFDNSRAIWVLVAMAVIFATIFRPLSFGWSLIDADNFPSVILLPLAVTLAVSNRKILHTIAVPFLFLVVIFDILIFHLSI